LAIRLSPDSQLVERKLSLSDKRTRQAAVTQALEEFIARGEKRAFLLELMGKLEWEAGYDYKR
jgi:hypothetical protein